MKMLDKLARKDLLELAKSEYCIGNEVHSYSNVRILAIMKRSDQSMEEHRIIFQEASKKRRN